MTKKANASHNAEQFIRSQGYTYFAFICYQHQDAKWAVWLKRKLQSYRLPTKACERYRGLPRQISPIFLDKDNMKPGELSSHERDEVQSAKYLIVICSKNACRRSKNMDDEIRYFTEGGFDPSRIIPFIVDDAQRPEEECFPQLLQEICRYSNIIGANIHDSGKNSAVLKVVAHMLGIKLEELESEDKRRRKRRNIFRAVAAAVLVIALCVGGYFVWDYYFPKYSYFVDYTEVYGLPQGIGALSKQETESMHEHYTIISQYGKVQELRHENAYGKLTDTMEIDKADRPVRATYTYSQDGRLSEMTRYDEKNAPIVKWRYDDENLRTVDIRGVGSDDGSGYGSSRTLMSHSVFYMSVEDESDLQSNVIRLLIDYDENGYVREVRYASSTLNHVGTDGDGIGGIRYERDEKGRVVRESYLTFIGDGNTATDPEDYEIIGARNGVASVGYEYQDDDCVALRFFDAKGKLTPGYKKVAALNRELENHNITKESYYDADESLMLVENQYALSEYRYDARGNIIEKCYAGMDEKPIMVNLGFAGYKAEFDDNGNVSKKSFFGADREPVVIEEGFVSRTSEYNADGHERICRYYGLDGELTVTRSLYAIEEYEYDSRGNVLKTSYKDEDGQLVMNSDGYAMCINTYDERDRVRKKGLYDTKGQPVTMNGGWAFWEYEYDEWGNLTQISCLGPDGKCTMNDYGYAIWKCEYNERGNPLSMSFYDADGEPVVSGFGWFMEKAKYDEQGNEVEKSYIGTTGELAKGPDGYAYYQCEHDAKGNVIEKKFFDVNQLPAKCNDGYASCRGEYDAAGRMISLDFFGVNGERVYCVDGYASCTWQYDERGEITNIVYCGVYGEPLMTPASGNSADKNETANEESQDDKESEGSKDDASDLNTELPQQLYSKAIGFVTDLVTG